MKFAIVIFPIVAVSAAFAQGDSLSQPVRIPDYQPIIHEIDTPPAKRHFDLSLASVVNPGRPTTYGLRFDYGLRSDKSRLSLLGALGFGYNRETKVTRVNTGIGVCFSQIYLKIGRAFALASGCGVGFWTTLDSPDDRTASSTEKSGPFVQNEWFLLNTRAEFTIGIVRCFGNLDLLMSLRRFMPSAGFGILFPFDHGEFISESEAK